MPKRGSGKPPKQVYTYRAHDDSGRVICGTTDELSKEQIVRRLAAKGYTVDVLEGDQRTPEERALEVVYGKPGVGEAPLQRVRNTILEEAVKQRAESIRVCLPKGERTMLVSYLIAGTWHDVMGLPSYVWHYLQADFAGLAGVKLSYGVAREPGRVICGSHGDRVEFAATFRRKQFTLTRV